MYISKSPLSGTKRSIDELNSAPTHEISTQSSLIKDTFESPAPTAAKGLFPLGRPAQFPKKFHDFLLNYCQQFPNEIKYQDPGLYNVDSLNFMREVTQTTTGFRFAEFIVMLRRCGGDIGVSALGREYTQLKLQPLSMTGYPEIRFDAPIASARSAGTIDQPIDLTHQTQKAVPKPRKVYPELGHNLTKLEVSTPGVRFHINAVRDGFPKAFYNFLNNYCQDFVGSLHYHGQSGTYVIAGMNYIAEFRANLRRQKLLGPSNVALEDALRSRGAKYSLSTWQINGVKTKVFEMDLRKFGITGSPMSFDAPNAKTLPTKKQHMARATIAGAQAQGSSDAISWASIFDADELAIFDELLAGNGVVANANSKTAITELDGAEDMPDIDLDALLASV